MATELNFPEDERIKNSRANWFDGYRAVEDEDAWGELSDNDAEIDEWEW